MSIGLGGQNKRAQKVDITPWVSQGGGKKGAANLSKAWTAVTGPESETHGGETNRMGGRQLLPSEI